MGTTTIPDLRGKTLATVNEALAATSLRVETEPASPEDDAQVVEQHPDPYQPASHGFTVKAVFAGPIPALEGLTLDQASTALKRVGLELVPAPDPPAAGATVEGQDPEEDDTVPPSREVNATFSA